MDTLPYGFIDRVFTQLDASAHDTIRVRSSRWMNAAWRYKQNLQFITVQFSIDSATQALSYILSSYGFAQDRNDFTFEDLQSMDDRFIRIDEFSVEKDFIQSSRTFHEVEDLPMMIRYLARFTIAKISIVDPHAVLLEECMANGLKSTNLQLAYSLETETLLKNHIASGELERFAFEKRDFWPLTIQYDLEEFVCQPRFKFLEGTLKHFDMDCFKRVVAYWRTMETPWKSAELYVHNSFNTDLEHEFAPWLISMGFGRFKEQQGEYCLLVRCERVDYVAQFGLIAELL